MLKYLTALFAALCLAACQQSTSDISAKAKAQLQQSIDQALQSTASTASVSSVVVVKEEGNKYLGEATVDAYGGSFKEKFVILADSKQVMLNVDEMTKNALVAQIIGQRLSTLDRAYSDAILEPRYFTMMPPELQKNRDAFAERLQTIVPIEKIGPYYFGSGIKARSGGSDEAAWAINSTNGQGFAVVMITGKFGVSYSVYGAEPLKLPKPLLDWAVENGMNRSNYAYIRDLNYPGKQ